MTAATRRQPLPLEIANQSRATTLTCINPAGTLGNLNSICPSSGNSIANEPYTQSIMYTVPNPGSYGKHLVPDSLVISAQGFDETDRQEMLVHAVQAAVSANGLIQWDRGQQWAFTVLPISPRIDQPALATYKGTCDLATFSSYIGVDLWSNPGESATHLDITISLPNLDNGFCGALVMGIDGLGSAVAGAFGGPLAVFLGAIGTVCAIVGAVKSKKHRNTIVPAPIGIEPITSELPSTLCRTLQIELSAEYSKLGFPNAHFRQEKGKSPECNTFLSLIL